MGIVRMSLCLDLERVVIVLFFCTTLCLRLLSVGAWFHLYGVD